MMADVFDEEDEIAPFPIEALLTEDDRETIRRTAEEIVTASGEQPFYLKATAPPDEVAAIRGLSGSFMEATETSQGGLPFEDLRAELVREEENADTQAEPAAARAESPSADSDDLRALAEAALAPVAPSAAPSDPDEHPEQAETRERDEETRHDDAFEKTAPIGGFFARPPGEHVDYDDWAPESSSEPSPIGAKSAVRDIAPEAADGIETPAAASSAEIPPLPPEAEHLHPKVKDRRVALLFAGAGLIAAGLIAALIAPVRYHAVTLAGEAGAARAPLISESVVCGLVALVFVLLGFGSMFVKRWARPAAIAANWVLLLAGSAILLGMGLFFDASVAAVERSPAARSLFPDLDERSAMLAVAGILGGALVLVPGLFITFFSAPNVAGTFAAFDPARRWTDQVSTALLTVCALCLAAAAAAALAAVHGSPFAGGDRFLTGDAARAAYAGTSVLGVALAFGLFSRRMGWWWTAAAASVLAVGLTAGTLIAADRTAFTGVRVQSAMLPEAISRAELALGVVLIGLGFLGALCAVRRSFRAGNSNARHAPAAPATDSGSAAPDGA